MVRAIGCLSEAVVGAGRCLPLHDGRHCHAPRGASNTAVQDANPQVVEIGQEIEMQVEVQNIPMGSKYRPFKVYPIAAFEDDDGNRFGWTLDRTGGKPDDEISGRWEFVDENYPLASTGVLRELLDQAQSWPPDSAT